MALLYLTGGTVQPIVSGKGKSKHDLHGSWDKTSAVFFLTLLSIVQISSEGFEQPSCNGYKNSLKLPLLSWKLPSPIEQQSLVL